MTVGKTDRSAAFMAACQVFLKETTPDPANFDHVEVFRVALAGVALARLHPEWAMDLLQSVEAEMSETDGPADVFVDHAGLLFKLYQAFKMHLARGAA